MNRTDLENELNTLGVQVYYNHTRRKDEVKLPYIVYLDTGTRNFVADNKVYNKIMDFTVILFAMDRNENLEGRLEEIFDRNELPYSINDIVWDEDQTVWMTSYDIQLIYE